MKDLKSSKEDSGREKEGEKAILARSPFIFTVVLLGAILIVAVFMVARFFGVFKDKDADESATATVDTRFYVSQEPVNYTIFMPVTNATLDYTNNPVWIKLQEMTNVHFTFISPVTGDESSEALNLILASGEYPDVILNTTSGYPGGFSKAIQDGIFIDIKPYLAAYAPNYKKIIEGHDIFSDEVYTDKGELPGFWRLYEPENALPIIGGMAVREDFLEQTGQEVPTTIDEWTDFLRTLKKIKTIQDPLIFGQQNGVNVTAEFLSAFGIGAAPTSIMNPVSQLFYPADGTIHYGAVEKGYQEYLLLMNQWYEEGLLDKDFGIRKFIDVEERMRLIKIDGTAAIDWQYAEWYSAETADLSNPVNMTAIPAPKLKETDPNVMWPVSRKPNIGELIAITTHCKDPIPLIKFFDFLYSEEGILLTNYGIENDTFVYKNGTPVYTDKILDYEYGPLEGIAKYINNHNGVRYDLTNTFDLQKQIYSDEIIQMKYTWLENVTLIDQNYNLTLAENTELVNIMNSISDYVAEYSVKAIVDREVALDWDSHVRQIYDMGLQKALDIMQRAYNRQKGD